MWVRDLTLNARAADGLRGLSYGQAGKRCRQIMLAHRAVTILLASAALYACAMIYTDMHQHTALSATGVTIASVSYVASAVIAIMRWPLWLPIPVTTAGAVAMMATRTPDSLIGPALVTVMFVFSLRSDKTPVIAWKLTVVGVLLLGHFTFELHSSTGWADLAIVPWIVVAGAIGQAVRSRQGYLAAVEERARSAEHGREQEARRRVQQERLRIARELHDAVGHHVALISVQAGAMGYLLDTNLNKARESLAHIQWASEAALEELRLTVGLLRQPGDREPTEPAGGLGRLDELIGSFAATGLRVTCDVSGTVRPLPEAVDLTAYRVIQESLTNAAKHAPGAPAAVRLAFRPGVLALAVEDEGSISPGGRPPGDPPFQGAGPPKPPPGGNGLIGMRERAVAVGGWLTAGPRSGGGFLVQAEFPAPVGAGS